MVAETSSGHDGAMNNKTSQSNRLLVWMGAGLLALLAVAAIAVALRSPANFEPGSPEAVVQEYVNAVLDEDSEAAFALLTPSAQRRCKLEDLEDRYIRGEQSRIVLVDSEITGDTATVELEFTAASGDSPFDIYEYSFEQRFKLRDVDGAWRLSAAQWPFYRCTEG